METQTVPVCRYCYETNGNFISICKCKGSIKWVHRNCAERWITLKQDTKCPICFSEQQVQLIRRNLFDYIWDIMNIEMLKIHLEIFLRILLFIVIYTFAIEFFLDLFDFLDPSESFSIYLAFIRGFNFQQWCKLFYFIHAFIKDSSHTKRMVNEYVITAAVTLINHNGSFEIRVLFGYYLFLFFFLILFLLESVPIIKNKIKWNKVECIPIETINVH